MFIPVLLSILALRPDSTCTGPTTAPRLDHVVLAVSDLDAAKRRFAALGFRLKPGRLHANNLLNSHIKFRDGSELELMTVAGPARDRMAEEYRALIAAGDGGAYVALRTADLEAVAAAARRLHLAPRRATSGSWEFLSFPPRSDAGAVFFVAGGERSQDPDSLVRHADGSLRLQEAWVEAGPGLTRLLSAIGVRTCSTAAGPGGRNGRRRALGSGSLVIVPLANPSRLPRVLGAVLATPDSSEYRGRTRSALPSFWLGYR
ncbi:MAG TPA: VOC family protein [Gemmatimonadales bacterium]